jgi:DUF2933 family protein
MDALLAILPFALLFLFCPLMMLFMHRGQDHHTDERAELLRLRGGGPTAATTTDERTSKAAHH